MCRDALAVPSSLPSLVPPTSLQTSRAKSRGLYRAIHRALFLEPHWLPLSAAAKLTLLVLKTLLHTSGIEARGPAALTEAVTTATDLTHETAAAALDELTRAGWLMRDARTVWVVDQLAWDEGMSAANWRHRRHVQMHLASIPAGPVLNAWRERYAGWLVPAPDPDSDADSLSDTLSHRVEQSQKQKQIQIQKPTTVAVVRGELEGEQHEGPATERHDATRVLQPPEHGRATASSSCSHLDAWLTPARQLLAARGRRTGLAGENVAVAERLYREGVSAEEVTRRARNLLAAPHLDVAGLSYLFKEWERWGGREVEAEERWRFYVREQLTRSGYVAALIPELVARGEWPSVEAAEAELGKVKPWMLARMADTDRRRVIALVAERLSA